jgi:hypothetical protein
MGLISNVFVWLFGDGRNLVRETSEVFRENAEARAQRGAALQTQALAQLSSEFSAPREGRFDRFMNGLNRLPRPALALGILGLFVASMIDPIWFASRMQGLILVPEPLWWLLGVIVSFYFGARHQVKSHQFQTALSQTMLHVPEVVHNLEQLQALAPAPQSNSEGAEATAPPPEITVQEPNSALIAWRAASKDM